MLKVEKGLLKCPARVEIMTRSPLSAIQSLQSWRLLATEPKLFPPTPTVSPSKQYGSMVKITAATAELCKTDHEADTQGRIHGQLLQQMVHFIHSSHAFSRVRFQWKVQSLTLHWITQ